MEAKTGDVTVTVDAGVATFRLNRPEKRNAMSIRMCEDLRRYLAEIKADDSVKVVVVTGQGTGFCAGSDAELRLLPRIVGGHYVPLERTRAETLEPVMLYLAQAFHDLGKPIIAAVNGVAAGGGVSIALSCDIRIASEKARFTASWVNVGLAPDCGATYLLPRLVGLDRALRFFYTGESIDAREAERIGLVTEVAPHDNLMTVVGDLAQKIASGPSVAIELTRRAAYRSLTNDLVTQLYFENYAQEICFRTRDFIEGVNAFREKRKPRFTGN